MQGHVVLQVLLQTLEEMCYVPRADLNGLPKMDPKPLPLPENPPDTDRGTVDGS